MLEREGEASVLRECVEDASAGRGSLLLIEAPAGLGKTRLAELAVELAEAEQLRALRGRGGELERNFRFGVVRQLFDSVVAGLELRERDEVFAGAAGFAALALGRSDAGVAGDTAAVLHGLYWLTSNVAAAGPLALIVDDAHWSDRASLEWLVYLARRVDDLPVALVVCYRPDEPGAESDLLSQLAGEPRGRLLRPSPLSRRGVTQLIDGMVEGERSEAFDAACHETTGGNPFLLVELLAAAREQGLRRAGDEAGEIRRLGPESISRAVLLRLRRTSETAVEVARAVALLGAAAELRYVAAFADISIEQAAEAVDVLVQVGVLDYGRRLDFAHPILREAVYADLAPAARSFGHRRAAALLRERRAAAELVAAQLVASDPDRDPNVVTWLVEIADEMFARGSPASAIDYLERALLEPPGPEALPEVQYSLGYALHLVEPPTARVCELLSAALQHTNETRRRAEIMHVLGRALAVEGRSDLAFGVWDDAIKEVGEVDPEFAFELEVERIGSGIMWPQFCEESEARLQRLRRPLEGRDTAECTVLGALAILALWRGEPASTVAELADRALRGGALVGSLGSVGSLGGFRHGFTAYLQSLFALLYADRFEAVAQYAAYGTEIARQQASLIEFATVAAVRSIIALRTGAVLEAETHARAAIAATERFDVPLTKALYVGALVDVLVEQNALEEAESLLQSRDLLGDALGYSVFNLPFLMRANLRFAQGRLREGLEDVLVARDRELSTAIISRTRSAPTPWRSMAAKAYMALDQREEALALAHEELAISRDYGAPRQLGVALRAAGVVEGGATGMELLRESIDVLSESPARLELARSMTDYGAALRRARSPTEARDPLRRGLELALRCGGAAVAERARAELLAAGRPTPPGRAVGARLPDRERAQGRRDGGAGHDEPRDRPSPVRVNANRRNPPRAHLPEAGAQLSQRACARVGEMMRAKDTYGSPMHKGLI